MKVSLLLLVLVHFALCIHTATSSLELEFQQLQSSCTELKEKTIRLKYTYQDLKDDNEKLNYRIRNLKQYVNDVETYYRIENLEILGVPRLKGEDLVEILRNISEAIDLPFNVSDISSVWRKQETSGNNYHKKTQINSIIVRFVSRMMRNKWLKRGRKKIVIYSKFCLPNLPESEIYINEHLTNAKKSLIKLAKQLEENNKIPYAWLKDGHLYIRRSPSGKAMKIKSVHDLKVLGLLP